MTTRRNFLKSVIALCGAAAVPTVLIEACASEAPVPSDWIIGIIDSEGEIVSQVSAASFESVTFPEFTRTCTITHGFVEGGSLPQRVTIPITYPARVCPGDTVHLTTHIGLL